MKRNAFIAALESELSGAVGPEEVTEQSTLQPKPGFGEDKELAEPSLDDVKADKEFGEDHPFAEHDEIDAVAESQETTIALEHLQSTIARFTRYVGALEELTEQVEGNLEADQPLTADQTIMLTTALDASAVGEPLAESVAVESFDFSARVATEGFVDTLKERTAKVYKAIAAFAERMGNELQIRYRTIAASFKEFPERRIAPLRKKMGKVVGYSALAGRSFENTKREKSIQSKIFAPSSTKTPIAALKEALAAYDAAANFMDTRLATAAAQVRRAYSTEAPEKVAAVVNKSLATVAELGKKHSVDSAYSTILVDVDIPTVTAENATKLNSASFRRKPATSGFDRSLKIASEAELKELEGLVVKAGRVFQAKVSDVAESYVSLVNMKSLVLGFANDSKGGFRKHSALENPGLKGSWNYVKMVAMYRYSMYVSAYIASSVELGLAEAVYRNAVAACDWAGASIAEAAAYRKAHGVEVAIVK